MLAYLNDFLRKVWCNCISDISALITRSLLPQKTRLNKYGRFMCNFRFKLISRSLLTLNNSRFIGLLKLILNLMLIDKIRTNCWFLHSLLWQNLNSKKKFSTLNWMVFIIRKKKKLREQDFLKFFLKFCNYFLNNSETYSKYNFNQ